MKRAPIGRAMYLASGILLVLAWPCRVIAQVHVPAAPQPVVVPGATTSEPPRTSPDIPATPPPYDEIVVTAVGDVMLGTTFPDTSGAGLPPNDGADILQEVTPLLKRGDVVLGNLEGPILYGRAFSPKCPDKAQGHFSPFRSPPRSSVPLHI